MANYDPNKHHRRSIRLKNYDYASAGAYFVTICVQHRQSLFGQIVAQSMQLNEAGQMIQSVWQLLPEWFPHIEMDEFVVMPNHFHGILVIHNRKGTRSAGQAQGGQAQGHAPTMDKSSVGVSLVDTPLVDTPLVDTPLVDTSLVDTPLVDTPNMAGTRPAPTTNMGPTLGNMVGAFKSITTHQYIQGVRKKDWPAFEGHLWQRNYWEHIIRNEESLFRLREYIQSNPITWDQDSLHPNSNPEKRDNP